MNWTEPKPPTDGVSYYNHTICETPIGKFIIEWKSWKESDTYDITKDSVIYVGYGDTLEEAKELVKKYLIKINNELTAFLKPIKRCLQCNNYIEKSSRPKKFCNERCSSKFRLQKKKNQFFRQLQELEFNVNGIQLKGKYLSTIAESVIKIEVTYDESEVTEVGATANVHQSFLVR